MNQLRVIYSLFLGLLFAILVGVGIATFYPGPKAPVAPIESYSLAKEETPAQLEERQRFDQAQRSYEEAQKPYSRNVSLIALVAAILALVVGLGFMRKLELIADGLLLGGVFLLIYSIIRGFVSEDVVFRFIVVCIGFALAVALGYLRFVRPETRPQKQRH